ncbi:MAG: ABC transporter permease [Candidatus Aminicenantes bacterium]|nr:ABC transporter permease [Candidatus Aminicenantes bacterium]
MLKNYLKIAWRNLLKNKAYSFINILGLAIGIAASVLIFLYVRDESSYDHYHAQADRIYRITADWSNKGDSRIHQLGTPSILARTLRTKYPQAESVTQFFGPLGDTYLKKGESGLKVADVYGAEPYLFDIFSFPLVQGDPKTALSEPTRPSSPSLWRPNPSTGKIPSAGSSKSRSRTGRVSSRSRASSGTSPQIPTSASTSSSRCRPSSPGRNKGGRATISRPISSSGRE